MANKKVDIEDFPELDEVAKQRIQDALQEALERELRAAGHPNPTGVFGDGRVGFTKARPS